MLFPFRYTHLTASVVKATWMVIGQPVVGSIKPGWDYCSCYRTKAEIEKAAESKRYFDLERERAHEGSVGIG